MIQNNKKRATIRDVAKLANVSVATVSRFLNGKKEKMTAQTAATIADAIEKLKYVPNSAAREMSNNSSKIVAVLIANLADYFSTEIFEGASKKLEAAGYIPVLLNTDSDQRHEQQLLNSINLHGFDGLLFQPLNSDTKVIKEELTRDFPVVILDRKLNRSEWPQVITDNYDASKNATEQFTQSGYKHIVVLSSTIEVASTRRDRFKAIQDTASDIDVVEIDELNFNHEEVYKKLKAKLTVNKKSLLFSLKERWLLEFLPELMKDNIISKEQCMVTGFADTKLIKSICPYAKVISQNPSYMGEQAAELLLRMLNNDEHVPETLVIKAKFKE